MTLGRCAQWHNITSVYELHVETLTLDLMRTYDCWLVILMLGLRQKMYEMDIFHKWTEDAWSGIPSGLGENPLDFWWHCLSSFWRYPSGLCIQKRRSLPKSDQRIPEKNSFGANTCPQCALSNAPRERPCYDPISSLPTAWRTVRLSNFVLQSCQSTRVTS